jgi:hypothetical protein
MVKPLRKLKLAPATPLKLDLGCGPHKREGFVGIDVRAFPSVDKVADLTKPWPWADASVTEVHASHFVEHLTADQRVHFVNELWRVLIPGGTAQVITPWWASTRAYGDLTHQWPPVTPFWHLYLNKEWREANAPHSNYDDAVNFVITHGVQMSPEIAVRNQEYQQFAVGHYIEAAQDMVATWTKPA